MTVMVRHRPITRPYVSVPCTCGRILRASVDAMGTEIRCWDCKKSVLVPYPKSAGRVIRALRDGVRDVLRPKPFLVLLSGATAVTASLLIPAAGLIVAAGLFILFASIYGALAHWTDRRDPERLIPYTRAGLLWRGLLWASLGLLMVAPWLFCRWGMTSPPKVTRVAAVCFGLAAFAIPLVMWLAFNLDRVGADALRRLWGTFLKHPFATFVVLAIAPICVVLLELGLVAIATHQEVMPFMVVDLFPRGAEVSPKLGSAYINDVEYRVVSDSVIRGLYVNRLRQGFSLIGAIPASLSLPTNTGFNPEIAFPSKTRYLVLRVIFSEIAVVVMLACLAIQARWLALISTLETPRRSVS